MHLLKCFQTSGSDPFISLSRYTYILIYIRCPTTRMPVMLFYPVSLEVSRCGLLGDFFYSRFLSFVNLVKDSFCISGVFPAVLFVALLYISPQVVVFFVTRQLIQVFIFVVLIMFYRITFFYCGTCVYIISFCSYYVIGMLIHCMV